MKTMSEAKAIIKESASNTVIVSPPLFVEWESRVQLSHEKDYNTKTYLIKANSRWIFTGWNFLLGFMLGAVSFIINIYHRFIGNYVKMMEVIDEKLNSIKT